jgi:hypothetical protein
VSGLVANSERSRAGEDWDEIDGFQSPEEFRRFERWSDEALAEEALVEIPVTERYAGASVFSERWFLAVSGRRWRLVSPDPPFLGVFEMVG